MTIDLESPRGGTGPAIGESLSVETFNLTRQFGSFTAVKDLTIGVRAGSIYGLLGPNGAGKSTTIKMLTTLLKPTSGTARVADFDVIRDPRSVRSSIGYVPQSLSADGTLTGYENLLVSAKLYSVPGSERKKRIDEALELMGLQEAANNMVRSYSGGMIRRLEIAQSMLHRPAVMFLDEPTVGLDPVARRAVWKHVVELRQEFDTTFVITTHYMEEADELCDMVAIMHLGVAVAIDSPANLKAAQGSNASLDDVFVSYTGGSIENEGGTYRDVVRTRRTARRLS